MARYEFWTVARIVMDKHIYVDADNYEDAVKQAKDIADKQLENIPTEVGEVVRGDLCDEDNEFQIW